MKARGGSLELPLAYFGRDPHNAGQAVEKIL